MDREGSRLAFNALHLRFGVRLGVDPSAPTSVEVADDIRSRNVGGSGARSLAIRPPSPEAQPPNAGLDSEACAALPEIQMIGDRERTARTSGKRSRTSRVTSSAQVRSGRFAIRSGSRAAQARSYVEPRPQNGRCRGPF